MSATRSLKIARSINANNNEIKFLGIRRLESFLMKDKSNTFPSSLLLHREFSLENHRIIFLNLLSRIKCVLDKNLNNFHKSKIIQNKESFDIFFSFDIFCDKELEVCYFIRRTFDYPSIPNEFDLFFLVPQHLYASRGADSDTHNRLIETLITDTLAGIGSLGRYATTTFSSSFRSFVAASQLRDMHTADTFSSTIRE